DGRRIEAGDEVELLMLAAQVGGVAEQDLRRWEEGDDERRGAVPVRQVGHAVQEAAMAAMHPVEVAYAEHDALEVRFRQVVVNAHVRPVPRAWPRQASSPHEPSRWARANRVVALLT